MNGPSKSQRATPSSGANSRERSSLGYMVACLALYTVAMAGVRFYAHNIGVVGGVLTILGMCGAVRWYDHRRNKAEILPKERTDDRSP